MSFICKIFGRIYRTASLGTWNPDLSGNGGKYSIKT